jgi:hypothetical protein
MIAAVLLARATMRLLVGQSTARETVRGIRALLIAEIELYFHRELPAEQVAHAIDRLQEQLRQRYPLLKHVFIEAQSLDKRPLAAELRGRLLARE